MNVNVIICKNLNPVQISMNALKCRTLAIVNSHSEVAGMNHCD